MKYKHVVNNNSNNNNNNDDDDNIKKKSSSINVKTIASQQIKDNKTESMSTYINELIHLYMLLLIYQFI